MSEGNKIKAWYIPAKENRFTLVYSHGYSSNREKSSVSTYNLAPIIHKMGGNFLSYDFSGEGESEGKTVTVGYREQEDLKNAIKEAHKKSKSPVFLYGLSMGAATTSIVAGNSNNIAGAICDSPFSNLRNYLESNLEVWSGLPKYPFQPIILNMEEKIAGVKLDKVDPQNSVKKLKVPMLIIHGKGDEKIPYTESIKIAENNKKMIPDLSSGALKNLIGEEFGKNFDNITVKVTGIKWQSDTIELTANVDGKNFLFPMVLNIRDINPEKDHVDQTDYFNEVKADLNSFKPANLNVKLTYKLENGKWVLDDKNFLKLLNALVFVKYYNKSVEESL